MSPRWKLVLARSSALAATFWSFSRATTVARLTSMLASDWLTCSRSSRSSTLATCWPACHAIAELDLHGVEPARHARHDVDGGLADQVAHDRDVVDQLATSRGPDFDGHRGAAAATATSGAWRAGVRAARCRRGRLVAPGPVEPGARAESGRNHDTQEDFSHRLCPPSAALTDRRPGRQRAESGRTLRPR